MKYFVSILIRLIFNLINLITIGFIIMYVKNTIRRPNSVFHWMEPTQLGSFVWNFECINWVRKTVSTLLQTMFNTIWFSSHYRILSHSSLLHYSYNYHAFLFYIAWIWKKQLWKSSLFIPFKQFNTFLKSSLTIHFAVQN